MKLHRHIDKLIKAYVILMVFKNQCWVAKGQRSASKGRTSQKSCC